MTNPLIPSIDLRGVPCMPVDVSRLLTSDTWLIAQDDPAVGYALVSLLLNAWHQVPAASVPSDARILARLAGVTAETWERIQTVVLSAWTLCDDGRYYHAVVAEKALAADEQRAKSHAYSQMQAAKGRASAAARATPATAMIIKKIATPQNVLPVANLPAAPATDPRQISLLDSVVAAETPVDDAKATAPKKATAAQEVFEHWQQVMQSKRSKYGPDRAKLINKWLADYAAEDLKLAIDGCRNDPFSMGQNERGTVYNGLELILRDRAHIEKFIAIATRENDKLISPTSGLSLKAQKTLDNIKKMMGRDSLGDQS